ncbi:hypothetical protein, partial [Paenibacillus sp. N3.4]|uniref:hypothetical protein n=1 Tax=Paenibacillus sp. N3.4 TaxID=2603222 RepID=UPI001C9CA467
TPAHITSLFIQLIAEIFSARVSPLHYPQLIDCLKTSVTSQDFSLLPFFTSYKQVFHAYKAISGVRILCNADKRA